MVAFLVMDMGPEARARLILQANDSSSAVGTFPSPRGFRGLGTQHWKALLYMTDAICGVRRGYYLFPGVLMLGNLYVSTVAAGKSGQF